MSLGLDGSFYGTTERGGPLAFGTVFKIGSGGMTVLYEFTDGADGAYPWAPPIQAPDGNIYGVTNNGTNPGRAYRITSAGQYSVIATIPSGTVAPLILGEDGHLYGTTPNGGDFNHGTVFQLTTAGKLTIIHSFDDGTNPGGPLLQAADGKLYGTTVWGGTFDEGIVYQLSAGGTYKVLHNFQNPEGANSTAGLVQGSDKFLYGVTQAGGVNGVGTLFKINTRGTGFKVLHQFATVDGAKPLSTPTLHTNGIIYGTTLTGGTPISGYGVFYSFDNGLEPFASLVGIWSGKVGITVGILGQGFLTATGVNFGSGPGTFTVVSDTFMTAQPRAGATTGSVTVLEPGGNRITPRKFKVTPTLTTFSPSDGPVGTSVMIVGMSLTQTSGVTFGGVGATSIVVDSNTQVTAIVPAGATTGKIIVTTEGGKATSASNFTVN